MSGQVVLDLQKHCFASKYLSYSETLVFKILPVLLYSNDMKRTKKTKTPLEMWIVQVSELYRRGGQLQSRHLSSASPSSRKVSLFASRKLYLVSQMLYQLLVLSVCFRCYYGVQRQQAELVGAFQCYIVSAHGLAWPTFYYSEQDL